MGYLIKQGDWYNLCDFWFISLKKKTLLTLVKGQALWYNGEQNTLGLCSLGVYIPDIETQKPKTKKHVHQLTRWT